MHECTIVYSGVDIVVSLLLLLLLARPGGDSLAHSIFFCLCMRVCYEREREIAQSPVNQVKRAPCMIACTAVQ